MNRTATFVVSILGRSSLALGCGLMPAVMVMGCVGTIGGDDTGVTEAAAGSGDSGASGAVDNNASLGTGGTTGKGDVPTTGTPTGTGTGGTATKCVYPAGDGDWTLEVGSTLPQTLHWQGFAEHSTAASTVKMEDYLDCDGSKGVNAILLDTSALWCGACQYEASLLTDKMASSWTAKGIRVLTLIIQDGQNNPATLQNASTWKDTFRLDSTAVVADPGFTLVPPSGNIVLPEMVLVNPRNMQITAIPEHHQQADMLVEQLAAANKLP